MGNWSLQGMRSMPRQTAVPCTLFGRLRIRTPEISGVIPGVRKLLKKILTRSMPHRTPWKQMRQQKNLGMFRTPWKQMRQQKDLRMSRAPWKQLRQKD